MANQFIETYKGARCHFHPEDGFWAERSCSEQYGYCDTIQQLREEIDWDDEEGEAPLDTPSIDDSFHRWGMQI
jgi:hypothetical protein